MSGHKGTFIDIGGRSLYARVCGSGRTVVLNSGGGRGGVGYCPPLESLLAQFATVVTYDRPGIGKSAPTAEYQTAADMVEDLNKLLHKLGVRLPAVLIGFSFSALIVQLYACLYSLEVGALLLLDPTPDAAFAGFQNLPSQVRASMRQAQLQNLQASNASRELLRDTYFAPESCEQVYRAIEEEHRMPDIPLVVITASLPPKALGKNSRYQMGQSHKRIVERVSRGRQVFAPRSSHETLVTDESGLIVDTVRLLLELSP